MAWIRDINGLYNFIGYVVLCAPDNFPVRDYLTADQQMTLDRAFAELRHGVKLVMADAPDLPRINDLESVLDEALGLYRSGEIVRAAQRLHDFEAVIFKS